MKLRELIEKLTAIEETIGEDADVLIEGQYGSHSRISEIQWSMSKTNRISSADPVGDTIISAEVVLG